MSGASASQAFSKARVEALSDGVFAIAMTLLVLELKLPELPRDAEAAAIWHAIRERGPVFFSFFLTFLLSGQFWLWHHVLCHYTRSVDRALAFINIFFLMFVSLLPFSTGLLGAFSRQQPVSLGFYFGNQLALAVLLNVHWLYARHQGLLTDAMGDARWRRFTYMLALYPLACAVPMALLFVAPAWSFRVFASAQIITVVVARRAQRSEAT